MSTPFFSEKLDNLDPSSKLPRLPAKWSGVLVIDECRGIPVRKGGNAYIAEFTVESSSTSSLSPNDPSFVAVGGRHSWYQAIPERDAETAWRSCVGFLLAALQLQTPRDQVVIDTQIKPQQSKLLNASISPQNPLRGQRVFCQTSLIETKTLNKETGKPNLFLLYTFFPAPAAPAQNAA